MHSENKNQQIKWQGRAGEQTLRKWHRGNRWCLSCLTQAWESKPDYTFIWEGAPWYNPPPPPPPAAPQLALVPSQCLSLINTADTKKVIKCIGPLMKLKQWRWIHAVINRRVTSCGLVNADTLFVQQEHAVLLSHALMMSPRKEDFFIKAAGEYGIRCR